MQKDSNDTEAFNNIQKHTNECKSMQLHTKGCLYDSDSDSDIDSYVSFGKYYDPSNPDKIDFVNGREPAILLEFNCDGPIFEKI